ncbi:hypothetical protein CASFOL_030607 [Castilleja foliolosa]|uniref:Uncharacterized protein n=1 Tax=Castilleja foliolosa TaxID=1961234 RepID=A0ABD3C5S8_9LAMI
MGQEVLELIQDGKDRYPYPVGYKSLRTHTGVTYTMEIFEGLKGPSFTISSFTDGKTCTGDKPEIAWDSFQKKRFSKLWQRKRFPSKIDGVERLLRELISNVGGTAEQSLSQSNLSSGVCETVNQTQSKPSSPDPILLTYLVKSHVKGKRSKVKKVVNNKRLDGTNFESQQVSAWPYKEIDDCGFIQGLFGLMSSLCSWSPDIFTSVRSEIQQKADVSISHLCFSLSSYLYFVTKKSLRYQTVPLTTTNLLHHSSQHSLHLLFSLAPWQLDWKELPKKNTHCSTRQILEL